MKKALLFALVLFGIINWASFALAQPGYPDERGGEVSSSREASHPVVRVYGPDVLTGLAAQAIMEKRPDVVVVTKYKALRNKVRIEGTTGVAEMQLSPSRVKFMKAAIAKGGSAYMALCTEQKGVIRKTVGTEKVVQRFERREYQRQIYVQPLYPPPPPPPVVYAPVVGVAFGGFYPPYPHGPHGRFPHNPHPHPRPPFPR